MKTVVRRLRFRACSTPPIPAHRALAYLVGYGLSPVLWRKLPGCRSAGRVQSVALRLLCEREAEIEGFAARHSWSVEAELAAPDGARFGAVLAGLDGTRIGGSDLASEAVASDAAAWVRAGSFTVSSVERDELRRQALPPFTTAALQQEASRRLGFSVAETMRIAQRLYEGVDLGGETAGLVTYIRTDSTAMAEGAVAEARAILRAAHSAAWVPARPRLHRARGRRVREAHEAIRPTDFSRAPAACWIGASVSRGRTVCLPAVAPAPPVATGGPRGPALRRRIAVRGEARCLALSRPPGRLSCEAIPPLPAAGGRAA